MCVYLLVGVPCENRQLQSLEKGTGSPEARTAGIYKPPGVETKL